MQIKKKCFYTEVAYLVALALLSLGTALMTVGGFGMSMVVAPAYIIYMRLLAVWPHMTFGLAEYLFQALLLVLLAVVVRRFRVRYLFAFVTAVLYGLCLDAWMRLAELIPPLGNAAALLVYAAGMLLCAAAISLFFRTYLSPEVYELFAKEVADRYGWRITVVKTVYDCASLLLGVVMSFALFGFGRFVGIGWGTLVCALVNGWLIGRFSALWDRLFVFRDLFSRKLPDAAQADGPGKPDRSRRSNMNE